MVRLLLLLLLSLLLLLRLRLLLLPRLLDDAVVAALALLRLDVAALALLLALVQPLPAQLLLLGDLLRRQRQPVDARRRLRLAEQIVQQLGRRLFGAGRRRGGGRRLVALAFGVPGGSCAGGVGLAEVPFAHPVGLLGSVQRRQSGRVRRRRRHRGHRRLVDDAGRRRDVDALAGQTPVQFVDRGVVDDEALWVRDGPLDAVQRRARLFGFLFVFVLQFKEENTFLNTQQLVTACRLTF